MKISEPTTSEIHGLSEKRTTALLAEMERLISLNAVCEYHLLASNGCSNKEVSFDGFNPKELSRWARGWASSDRFERNGALKQILFSGLGKSFEINDPLLASLPYCYIGVAQKMMFYSGEYEPNKNYLDSFIGACKEEIEGSVNIEQHLYLTTKPGENNTAEYRVVLSMDDHFFIVDIQEGAKGDGSVLYSVDIRTANNDSPKSALISLTRPYLKSIAGSFGCALWIEATGKKSINFIEQSARSAYR